MASMSSASTCDVCCTALGSAGSRPSSDPGLKAGRNAVVKKWTVLVSSAWVKALVASAVP